ncbi:hypothetical protein LTR17_005209 [Elasticomyces elasticus]|nr:hypothetical protein LTR17_005209 [Elasticomyces elasticus]
MPGGKKNKKGATPKWADYPNGQPYHGVHTIEEAKAILKSAHSGETSYEDMLLTKQILEACYSLASGQPAHHFPSESDDMQAGPSSAQSPQPPIPQPRAPLVIDQSPPKWELSFKHETGLGAATSHSTNIKAHPFKELGLTPQLATRVITNYVAINKPPPHVYVYTVAYKVAQDQVPVATAGSFPDTTDLQNALPAVTQASQSTNITVATAATSSAAAVATAPAPEPREITRRSEKRQVFKALPAAHAAFRSNAWATDCDKVWSLQPLNGVPDAPADLVVTDISYIKTTGRPANLSSMYFKYQWDLDFTVEPVTKTLLNAIAGTESHGASDHIAALNGLISKHASERAPGVIQVGPNKFFMSNNFTPLPPPDGGLAPFNAHRGYYSSVRPGSEKPLLNVNVKAGTFFNPMKVSYFLDSIHDKAYDHYGFLEKREEKLLLNRAVRVCYKRQVRDLTFDPNDDDSRIKTIVGLGKIPSMQRFVVDPATGADMSVMDYFVKVLKADPAPDDKYRCVNVGLQPRKGVANDKNRGKELWMPADFLELTPAQHFTKMLSPHDMTAMLNFAQHGPADTQQLIAGQGLDLLGLTTSGNVLSSSLGFHIDPCLLSIPAVKMTIPHVTYKSYSSQPTGASWNLLNKDKDDKPVSFNMAGQAPSKGVHVLDFRTFNERNLPKVGGGQSDLGVLMTKRMVDHGIGFTQNAPTLYARSEPLKWKDGDKVKYMSDEDLESFVSDQHELWKQPQLYLVLLDDTDSTSYAKIKRTCDQKVGVHTVCLTAAKMKAKGEDRGPDSKLLSNLALKFNIKLGGQNHQVSTKGSNNSFPSAFTAIAPVIMPNTIVLGADVSHAPSQMSHCPSVAAVVGSIDKSFAQFPGSMRLQACGQETIEELEDMVKERVLAYASKYPLPTHMIFYRDGVGEDQFDCAKSVEIERVRQGFESARRELRDQGRTPHANKLVLTFIVVGKRHHTRFFPSEKDKTAKDKLGNITPGLLVDSVITRPLVDKEPVFDFFLQSHAALKGTAKSAHYIVLESGGFKPQMIKELTHAFCYNYARATKGVSYAGPAYYADRLAERGTHYLKGYTTDKSEPPEDWTLSDEEIEALRAEDPMKVYQKRVADKISEDLSWNPGFSDKTGRKNPWVPEFDKVMFWL